MTKAKHTPAPWYYDEQDYVREVSTDYCIVRILEDNAHPNPIYVEKLPKRPNALLIAAAPELLEALKVAHDWLREFSVNWGSDEGQKIRAAIAKATEKE